MKPGPQAESLCQKKEQGFALFHEIPVINPAPVPFQKGKFGEVQIPPFPFSETPGNLKDPGKTFGQKAFHAQLGRGLQVAVANGDGFNMGFRGGGGNCIW